MDIQTAQYVLGGLTAVLLAVWISALLFTWRTSARSTADDEPLPADYAAGSDGRVVRASAELPVSADELARKAARLLAQQGKLGLPLRVVDVTTDTVRFEASGPVGPHGIRSGEAHYRPVGPELAAAECSVVVRPPGRVMLRLAAGFLVLGLVAIATAVALIDAYVVHSPNPNLRAQVFQVLQAIHFVWPPFLFAGIYRGQRSAQEILARRLLDGLTHNLPYVD